jgi:glucose dehydrogenase
VANGHGGSRPGAGRKSTGATFASEIQAAKRRIADQLPQLIDNLLTLANGVTVHEVDQDGGVKIYAKPPDRKANEYLINRILGTPMVRIEADIDPEGTIEATGEALSEAARELAEWRKQMTEQLSSLPSAPPTLPTSPTST